MGSKYLRDAARRRDAGTRYLLKRKRYLEKDGGDFQTSDTSEHCCKNKKVRTHGCLPDEKVNKWSYNRTPKPAAIDVVLFQLASTQGS